MTIGVYESTDYTALKLTGHFEDVVDRQNFDGFFRQGILPFLDQQSKIFRFFFFSRTKKFREPREMLVGRSYSSAQRIGTESIFFFKERVNVFVVFV